MENFDFEHHATMVCHHGSDEFNRHVFEALEKGSSRWQRTPFWHASVSLAAARQWRVMADNADPSQTGSQPSKVILSQ